MRILSGPKDRKLTIWRNTRRSYTLDRTGRIEIRRRSRLDLISLTCGISLILAVFQADGNVRLSMQLFSVWVNDGVSCSAAILRNLTELHEQSFRSFFNSERTSLQVTLRRWNELPSSSGRWSISFHSFFGWNGRCAGDPFSSRGKERV